MVAPVGRIQGTQGYCGTLVGNHKRKHLFIKNSIWLQLFKCILGYVHKIDKTYQENHYQTLERYIHHFFNCKFTSGHILKQDV